MRLTDAEEACLPTKQSQVMAIAITSRNLMAGCLALSLCVTVYALYGWNVAVKRAESNVRVFHSVDRGGVVSAYDALPDLDGRVSWSSAVIMARLMDWTQWRYAKVARTIRSDLASAELFLSPVETEKFRGKNTEKGEFNAVAVAAEHEQCTNCPDILATPTNAEVVGEYTPRLARDPTTTYQYIVHMTQRTASDGHISETQFKRVVIHFRLLSEQEQAAKIRDLEHASRGLGVEYFRKNTPGIEILSYDIGPDHGREETK